MKERDKTRQRERSWWDGGASDSKITRWTHPPMRTPTFATQYCMDLHGVNRNSSGGQEQWQKNTLHSCSWGLFGIFPEFGQFYGAGDALFGSVCGGPMPPAQTNFHNLLSTNLDKRWQCMTSTRQTDETRKHVTDAAWQTMAKPRINFDFHNS